jgi:hypothetical protein
MTKSLLATIFSFFLFAAFSMSAAEEFRQVLEDQTFSHGFVITGAKHDQPKRKETFGQEGEPCWQIAQWNSKGLLENVQTDENQAVLSDSYKSVTLNRKTGAINLTVDASKEWNEIPRDSNSVPWPHLLLSQSPFKKPISIANAKAIWVEFDFELTKLKTYGTPNPRLHTAQVGWFLYLKNSNSQSKGFHDFLWFGLSLFDSRYDFTSPYAAQDHAMPNGKFIYTVGNKSYLKEKAEVGKRQKVRYNILPEIQNALEAAHAKGFIPHSTVNDMVFDGTNIGWEIPGVYDAGMTLYHLSVEVVEK